MCFVQLSGRTTTSAVHSIKSGKVYRFTSRMFVNLKGEKKIVKNFENVT